MQRHGESLPYFGVDPTATALEESSDPSKLESLKHELDQYQVYHWSDVQAFARVFYKPPQRQSPADHAEMQRWLQPAVDRFTQIEGDEQRSAFRDKLNGYVRVYAFLSQIIPYGDAELEMLYSYARSLLPHLPLARDDGVVNIADDVQLQYYRLERVSSGMIDLTTGAAQTVRSPTEVGTGKSQDDTAPLSEIIDVLNERFGTEFSEEDRLFFQQIKERPARTRR